MNIARTSTALLATGLLAAAGTVAGTSVAGTAEAAEITVHTTKAAFTTPSGNIGCIVEGDIMVCTVIDRHWDLAPMDCDHGSSDGVVVYYNDHLGPGCMTQAGQTLSAPGTHLTDWVNWSPWAGHVEYFDTWGDVAVLDYDSSIDTGQLVITSDETGVLIQTPTGHQGQISRENAILW